MYNLRHTSARNIVKRVFGILKKKWEILIRPPQFALKIQAQIPPALAAVHNFLRKHDPEDIQLYLTNTKTDLDPNPGVMHDLNDFGVLSTQAVTAAEKRHATAYRDTVAQNMWDQYQETLGVGLRNSLPIQTPTRCTEKWQLLITFQWHTLATPLYGGFCRHAKSN